MDVGWVKNLCIFFNYKKPRKNAIHPVLKEEEKVNKVLKDLLENGKIDEELP